MLYSRAGSTQSTTRRPSASSRDRSKPNDVTLAAKSSLGFIPDRPFIYEKLTGMEFLRFVAWGRLERPDGFNTWPLVSGLLGVAPERLEIGPGLRPRLPIAGTHFLDISAPAIERLRARGGQ